MNDTKFIISMTAAVLVMALLIFAVPKIYDFYQPANKAYETSTYNGFTVVNISGRYYTQIKIPDRNVSHNLEMRLPPSAVDHVAMELGIKEKVLEADGVFLTTDPDEDSKTIIAMVEIGKLLGTKYNILNKPTVIGLTEIPDDYTDQERAIVDCNNASDNVPVIYFRQGEATIVFEKENCIVVQGKTGDDVIMAADKLGYAIMGIIAI